MAPEPDRENRAGDPPGAGNTTAGGEGRPGPKPVITASDLFKKRRHPASSPPAQPGGAVSFPPPPEPVAADAGAPPAPERGPRPLTFGKIFGTARPSRRPEAPAEITAPAGPAGTAAPMEPIIPTEVERRVADPGSDPLGMAMEMPALVEKPAPPAVPTDAVPRPEMLAETPVEPPPSAAGVENASPAPLKGEIGAEKETALVEAIRAGSAGGQVAMALALATAARSAAAQPAGIPLEHTAPLVEKRPGRWVTLVQLGAKGFKVGLATVLVLGGIIYFSRSWLAPVTEEFLHPGRKNLLQDKHAPTAVRVLQQTRKVVAQNDARVDELNAIVSGDERQTPAAAPSAPKPAPAEAVVSRAPTAGGSPTSAYQSAVDGLVVTGVYEGDDPRIYLNGLLVPYGQIVDRTLGLRFIGVDPVAHAILFSNADNTVFKKHY